MKDIFIFHVYFYLIGMYTIKCREFRIAWMAPKREYHGLSAASSVGGIKLALISLDNMEGKKVLANHTIKVRWYDTDCNSKSALAAAVDAKEQFQPDVFLGPPCSAGMRGVAQLASHWDIPVFGWVSNDIEFKNKTIYSTLVRVLGPLNRLTTTLDYVASYFKWKIFAMIHDQRAPYRAAAEAIKQGDDYVITSTHEVNEYMDDKKVEEILQQVRKYARVIIFSVPWLTMRKYMLVAHKLGMSKGDFAFLCMHGDLYTYEILESDILSDKGWRRNDSQDDAARTAFESVFHITMDTIEKDNFKAFRQYAMTFANAQNGNWLLPNGTEPDAYAPYLYDATLTWALLVDESLKEGKEPTSGNLLLRKATKFYSKGVTGDIVLDEMGDRLLNFGVMDMQEDYTFERILSIHHNKTNHHNTEVKVLSKPARWPNGKTGKENAPPDKPACGFDNEFCVQDYTDTIVGAAAGSSFVLILAIAFNIVLRRYRRLKLLKSMIWQVRFEEIDFVTALLSGSVRASFRNLGRRRSVARKSVLPAKKSSNTNLPQDTRVQDSPQFHKPEHGTIFGSVAYVRGALVSVKRMSKNTINVTKEVIQELNQLMELKHQNLCAFVGSCIDPGRVLLLWEYCPKGSLQDVIWNQNIKLDRMFMFALSQDIAKGLEFVHKSAVHFHGNLKSSNCVVDSRWTCKLTDFGVPRIRAMDKTSISYNEDTLEKFLWTSPEFLRGEKSVDKQKADIFSIGIILKEIFTRSGPYTEYPFLSSVEIVSKVRDHALDSPPFRPMIGFDIKQCIELVSLIEECWHEDPMHRPSAARVSKSLNRINPSKNLTMIDSMLAILEKYANHLEELVAERTSELDAEKKKTENLLYRMLPQSVAEDLKLGKTVKAEQFDEATIYFSDIVGFTTICASSTPIEVVNLLNSLYTLFDDLITKYDVYKVETIGDAYMLASGLPTRNGSRHTKEICDCALDILASVGTFSIPHQVGQRLRIRVGIHSGPVVAGVVGLAMPRYCLFGDTVNTASRMESTGLPLKIHLSSNAKENLDQYPGYHLLCRGEINVKGKGIMKTYFLSGRDGFSKELPKIDEDITADTPKKKSMGEKIELRQTSSVNSDTSSYLTQQMSGNNDLVYTSKTSVSSTGSEPVKVFSSSEVHKMDNQIIGDVVFEDTRKDIDASLASKRCSDITDICKRGSDVVDTCKNGSDIVDTRNNLQNRQEEIEVDMTVVSKQLPASLYCDFNKVSSIHESSVNSSKNNLISDKINKISPTGVVCARRKTSTVGDVRRIIKQLSSFDDVCGSRKKVSTSSTISDMSYRKNSYGDHKGYRRRSSATSDISTISEIDRQVQSNNRGSCLDDSSITYDGSRLKDEGNSLEHSNTHSKPYCYVNNECNTLDEGESVSPNSARDRRKSYYVNHSCETCENMSSKKEKGSPQKVTSTHGKMNEKEKSKQNTENHFVSAKKTSTCSETSDFSECYSSNTDISSPRKKISSCSEISGSLPPDTPLRIDSLDDGKDLSIYKIKETIVEMTSL